MESISRRQFVSTGTAAAATAAVAGATAAHAEEVSSWLPETWDYETDVLVIGYGGAGLWTALTAVDEGGVEVLCLEKAPCRGGGNASINFGEFSWPSDVEKAVEYIMAFGKGDVDESVARAWAREASLNIDYCKKWGLENAMVVKGPAAGNDTAGCEYPFLPGADAMNSCFMAGNGNEGWQILDKARADQGTEVLFGCHDEELIQNPETKEIVGAWTLIGDDPEPKAVKARKAVCMTCGGFEFNDEMKRQYLKCYPMNGFFGWPFNTGDGFKMVEKVGARLRNMSNVIGGCWAWSSLTEQPYAYMLTPQGMNFIMVDRLGNRWCNETAGFNQHNGWHNFLKFNDAELCDFERIPTWYIMDQNVIDAGPLGQTEGGALNIPGGIVMYTGMGLPDIPAECGALAPWTQDNQAEIEAGLIKKGDTIEELVEAMLQEAPAPSAEAIIASIEKYNAACEAGEDGEFGRAAATLAPIATPPFYAFAAYPGGCNTLGGPKKNALGQVLDLDDQVIPRLYAAGSFGNMASHTYGILGGNNAENMVWGRIIARNAAAEADWDA